MGYILYIRGQNKASRLYISLALTRQQNKVKALGSEKFNGGKLISTSLLDGLSEKER